MKLGGVVATLVLMLPMACLSQGTTLKEKVRAVFLQELSTPDRQNNLRQLGEDNEIVQALIGLASRHRHAKERTGEFKVLNGVVASLGEYRARSANELLSSLLTDQIVHENVRALAARALGQIDPEANKQALLNALDPTGYLIIRVYAAEGLAQTRDPEALKALERYILEERDVFVRTKFQNGAEAMRANGVKPN
jgi:HEAT repeat protein